MDVRARSLSKDFPRGRGGRVFTAVEPTDLDIGAGELVVITGRSGSGKSTLLAMLAGILSPTAGTVEVDGTDLHSLGEEELARFRNESIGLVPQGHAALRSLTVLENVLLPSVLYPGRGPGGRGAEELLDAVGMAQLKDARPNELSGGELRRMAIARALLMDPGVVLADEPTTALDVTVQKQVIDLLNELREKLGFAMVFVSHDLALVAKLAHRITVMYAGQVVEQAPTSELLANPVHEYTRGLLGAVLSIESGSKRLHQVRGVVPSPSEFVKGDRFAPRSSHPTVGLETRPVLKPVPGTTEHSYAITPELEALLAKEKH